MPLCSSTVAVAAVRLKKANIEYATFDGVCVLPVVSASLAMLQQPQCRCLPTTGRLPRAGLCVTPSDRKRSRAGRCKRRASGGATTSSASVFATWCVHHTCRSLSCAHVLTLVPFGPLPRRSLPGAGEQVAGHQRPCHRPRRRTHRSGRRRPLAATTFTATALTTIAIAAPFSSLYRPHHRHYRPLRRPCSRRQRCNLRCPRRRRPTFAAGPAAAVPDQTLAPYL